MDIKKYRSSFTLLILSVFILNACSMMKTGMSGPNFGGKGGDTRLAVDYATAVGGLLVGQILIAKAINIDIDEEELSAHTKAVDGKEISVDLIEKRVKISKRLEEEISKKIAESDELAIEETGLLIAALPAYALGVVNLAEVVDNIATSPQTDITPTNPSEVKSFAIRGSAVASAPLFFPAIVTGGKALIRYTSKLKNLTDSDMKNIDTAKNAFSKAGKSVAEIN